jgi:NAD(P)-dependent dehydrogenase (short-subunit alcohol dehydrogenase family)
MVTGGASGIGQAITRLFAKEGAKVVIADIGDGNQIVADIKREHGTALYVKTDVQVESQVQALIDETVRAFGGIDIVCNSAGIELIRSLVETTEGEWDRIVNTNLRGPFFVCKHALPHMLRKGSGAIVNIASQLGIMGLENMTAYCASKGGVILLTKSMALEYAKKGIRVNCICPGAIDTPMVEREVQLSNDPEQARRAFVSKHPIGRLGTPAEIAQAALFLASNRSSFITGESLVVDGGYVIQ